MPDIKTKSLDAAPGQMKVWKARLVESGPEVTLIRVPISSTTEDRDGDEFSLAGLESMLAGLKSGKVPALPRPQRVPGVRRSPVRGARYARRVDRRGDRREHPLRHRVPGSGQLARG